MKKWLRFFCLSFFSDKISKEGAKRGYTNVFIGLILTFAFLWVGFVGGDLLPLGMRYDNSPDFMKTAHAIFANVDLSKRIDAEIKDGVLLVKNRDGEYSETLLINTFKNETDKQNYSANGYNVVVDLHPADTLAEIEAYCLSNDGNQTEISYDEYLTLSNVARLNFDFKLRYTGKALDLNDELVEKYKVYVDSLSEENKAKTESLKNELESNKITKAEYSRAIYELYFVNYYPEITSYESLSKVPLLRNYYYHEYIIQGVKNYLFIFDDYMTASFNTNGGIEVSFYGFYNEMEDGPLVAKNATAVEADKSVDEFMKNSISSIAPLTLYAHAMNIFSLIPFITLMPLVVTLLAYSVLKLWGIESITSFGALFKILGSYTWFSGVISAVLTVIIAFFVKQNVVSALPLVLFFLTLTVRSIIFAIIEARSYIKKSEEKETVLTEA